VEHLVSRYGADGLTLLESFGDDSILMVNRLEAYMDVSTVKRTIRDGPESLQSLSYWSDEMLIQYGDELAERAARDAIALRAAEELSLLEDLAGPEARDLLTVIAQNSIQGEGDRIVLGRWVPGSLDQGFIGTAREESALYYGPNPGLEAAFDHLDPAAQEDLFWAVNREALQQAVDLGWEIDYSLDGLDPVSRLEDIQAVKALSMGDLQTAESLYGGELPFRMREIDFLLDQGYEYQIDAEDNSIQLFRND
jgi:hypothetical protein